MAAFAAPRSAPRTASRVAARIALATLLCTLGTAALASESLLGELFQDHALLQRGQPIRIWGNARAGDTVHVALGAGSAATHADEAGHWQVTLPAQEAGGPYELRVANGAGDTQVAHDVLIGDLWLCSGQSNMEMQVHRVANLETEIAGAANAQIRLLHIEKASVAAPQAHFAQLPVWHQALPASVADFSAACYFFGREIQRTRKVPVGLIDSSWGGSMIQAWISGAALRTRAGYIDGLEALGLYQHDQAAAAAHWQQRIAQWWQARPAAAGSMDWTQASFDDAAWPLMRLGGIWEGMGIPALQNFDGVVWFRSTLTLDEAQARSASALELGPIDDMDTTWINGQEIGSTDGWDTPRHYALPPGALHAGVNEISVRVFDGGGGGGLYGTAQQRRVLLGDGSSVPLAEQWHYRIAGTLGEVGTPPHPPWQPAIGLTTLYNGMIHPLAGLALRGVLWYQGEANVGEPQEYAALLPLFMQDWRARFGAELPMLIVQLANFGPASAHPAASAWASLRNEQRRAVAADPHAGLAVTIDIGDRYDIHPTNKQEVGHRLALLARHRIYGEALEDSGPTPVHARREGKGLRIEFAHADGGLVVQGANRPSGFELCVRGAACRYVDASARGNSVWLESSAPAAPATVRYAWGDSPQCNLYNQAGLPAVPFEIDIE